MGCLHGRVEHVFVRYCLFPFASKLAPGEGTRRGRVRILANPGTGVHRCPTATALGSVLCHHSTVNRLTKRTNGLGYTAHLGYT